MENYQPIGIISFKVIRYYNFSIIAPAVAVSIFMTGLTFYFNDNLVPTSNKLAESTLRSGIGSSFNKQKGKNNIIFQEKDQELILTISQRKQIHS